MVRDDPQAPPQVTSSTNDRSQLINSVFAQLRGGRVPPLPELDSFEQLVRQAFRVTQMATSLNPPPVARSITGKLIQVGQSLLEKLHASSAEPSAPPQPASPPPAGRLRSASQPKPAAAPKPAPGGGSDDMRARERMARDPETPPEMLSKLASDTDGGVRLAVAHNSKTSPVLLMNMANDPDLMVRAAVAANPHTPARALARLADCAQTLVRVRVAQNPQTPVDVLARLATDSEAKVRQSVAANGAAPDEVLRDLESDGDENIREAAREALGTRHKGGTGKVIRIE